MVCSSVRVADADAVLAPSVGVDDEVDGPVGLALSSAVVCSGRIVAFGEQGAGKLGASALQNMTISLLCPQQNLITPHTFPLTSW